MTPPQFTQLFGHVFSVVAPIDEPKGSFARVWRAESVKAEQGTSGPQVALKVMRVSRLYQPKDYAAFTTEVEQLHRLRAIPQVVQMYECGYVTSQFANRGAASEDTEPPHVEEQIVSFGPGGLQEFRGLQQAALKGGWRPYISLELQYPPASLYTLVNRNKARPSAGWRRIPAHEVIEISEQYLQLLQHIHSLETPAFYHDTKPAHVYWYPGSSQLRVIDWNVIDSFPHHILSREELIRRDFENMLFDATFPALTGFHPPFGELYLTLDQVRTAMRGADTDEMRKPKFSLGPMTKELNYDLRNILTYGLDHGTYATMTDVIMAFRDSATKLGRDHFMQYALEPDPDKAKAYTSIREAFDLVRSVRDLVESARLKASDAQNADGRWLDRELTSWLSDDRWMLHG